MRLRWLILGGLAFALSAVAAGCGGDEVGGKVSGSAAATLPAGLQQVSSFSTASDGGDGSKTATTSCPTGKHLVGAGATFSASTSGNAKVALHTLAPLYDPRARASAPIGMKARGAEIGSTPGSWFVTGYAFCVSAPTSLGLALVASQSATNSTSPKSATAQCPSGKRIVGAGGEMRSITGTETRLILHGIKPMLADQFVTTPSSVTATGTETGGGTGQSWRVHAYVLCVNTSAVPSQKVVEMTSGPTSSSSSKTATVSCPVNQRLSGAAASIYGEAPPGTVAITGIQPNPFTGKFGVRATAAETGTGTSSAWGLIAYAICT